MTNRDGILYLASGQAFVNQAIQSANSVKEHNPNIPITIFTDQNIGNQIFDEVIKLSSPITDPGESILSEDHFPYDRTLYLDSDTYICGDISPIFEMLDVFDVVAAHNVGRAWWNEDVYTENNIHIPESFPEYNTGVVAYKNNSSVQKLFERWNDQYSKIGGPWNQPAFRVSLYDSGVNLGTLPPEYNFMLHSVGFASGPVKIIHQGPSDIKLYRFSQEINSTKQRRVTTWDKYPCRIVSNEDKTRIYIVRSVNKSKITRVISDAKSKVKKDGVISTIRAAIAKIMN